MKVNETVHALTSCAPVRMLSGHPLHEAFMQLDPALAAQHALTHAHAANELGSDWDVAQEAEAIFSSTAGAPARAAYDQLLALASRHPDAHAFQAFCIFITWQQVTEETIAHHFQTGVRLCEAYLATSQKKPARDVTDITELYDSFRDGLGLNEEDEIQVEFQRDAPKGGD